MISAGVEGRLPYMTYPEPWRGPPKQPPEPFLRPAPKPLPTSRYNGVNTSPAGTRLAPPLAPPSQRLITKYPPSPTIPASPVNLAQSKDDQTEDLYYPRIFPHSANLPQFNPFPYLYPQQPYLIGRNYQLPPTPLSPMETFTSNTTTFLSPNFSPPGSVKPGQSILRDKRTPPHTPTTPLAPPHQVSFKVPCGKEGSLKHRILTRPEDARIGPLDLQKPIEGRKRLQGTMSPPSSPKRTLNNNSVPGSFTKGSPVQLANGEIRRIEDMRTEDFISSAENNTELRLAESTVVKIVENPNNGNATITLSYNQRRAQVEVESAVEHPYFVIGQGWASCNPDKSQHSYGLKVHRLQVGDILISLTPREPHSSPSSRVSSTIMTTATTTAMTSRQVISEPKITQPVNVMNQPMNLQNYAMTNSPDRKRRWSAPDEICDDEEQNLRMHRIKVD